MLRCRSPGVGSSSTIAATYRVSAKETIAADLPFDGAARADYALAEDGADL
jgi:hypothetical protein